MEGDKIKTLKYLLLFVFLIVFSSSVLGWCYQESANTSSSSDGYCTLFYNGTYSNLNNITNNWLLNDSSSTIDGNWSSYNGATASSTAHLYINYTIPPVIIGNYIWEIKDELSQNNITINSSLCNLTTGILQFKITAKNDGTTDQAKYYCWYNNDWNQLLSHASGVGYDHIYEEGMYWKTNNINITVYNESTGTKITSINSTIYYSSNSTNQVTKSFNGTTLLEDLAQGEYQIIVTSPGSYQRIYYVTVIDGVALTLNAYLPTTVYTTVFSISDLTTGTPLQNVLVVQYGLVNGTSQLLENKYTDVTGSVELSYIPNINYNFYLTKADYQTYSFSLSPIIFPTYTIKMTTGSSTVNYSVDYEDLAIASGPHIFKNNNVTDFTFLISSPTGILTDYGYNLSYLTTSNSSSDTNVIGNVLTGSINITNASVFDTVRLDYYYVTNISQRRNFTFYYPIQVDSQGNNTFMSNQDNTYGLGIFERLLVITSIVLLVVGLSALAGQLIAGLVLGIIVYGFSVYVGFLTIWLVLPTCFIGIIFVIWKSGGQ